MSNKKNRHDKIGGHTEPADTDRLIGTKIKDEYNAPTEEEGPIEEEKASIETEQSEEDLWPENYDEYFRPGGAFELPFTANPELKYYWSASHCISRDLERGWKYCKNGQGENYTKDAGSGSTHYLLKMPVALWERHEEVRRKAVISLKGQSNEVKDGEYVPMGRANPVQRAG